MTANGDSDLGVSMDSIMQPTELIGRLGGGNIKLQSSRIMLWFKCEWNSLLSTPLKHKYIFLLYLSSVLMIVYILHYRMGCRFAFPI
ncbi:Piso0_003662 [Millerozyma farinosa CBS 7064]|uniref:Piso0_003662 protein n=1 Tax=Pichia sorbitophila (strain ATCC MYA-4447 / BCRC 22081 / CBS 7064 / NBRC 10061 / NRRL Y-12695) TaxID=559304 RepID=G8YJP8_PICSO|nr:Piso0_003662 [Millerozyma farinosa CBS 7064]CCE81308.1 Piso0_003662 [Millerozyma farinosa CBS 7064]